MIHRAESLMQMIVMAALACAACAQAAAQAASGTPPPKPKPIAHVAPTKENYLKFAGETEAMLQRDVLDVWFPRTVDNQNGGFNASFTRDWQPGKSEGKFSVFQGRMTWISSQVAMRRPELKDRFLPIAQHGVDYLSNILWDKQYGGFYWGLDDKGQITSYYTDGKHLYGISFVLYGAAAAYQATHDPRALKLAQDAFHWIDDHARVTASATSKGCPVSSMKLRARSRTANAACPSFR